MPLYYAVNLSVWPLQQLNKRCYTAGMVGQVHAMFHGVMLRCTETRRHRLNSPRCLAENSLTTEVLPPTMETKRLWPHDARRHARMYYVDASENIRVFGLSVQPAEGRGRSLRRMEHRRVIIPQWPEQGLGKEVIDTVAPERAASTQIETQRRDPLLFSLPVARLHDTHTTPMDPKEKENLSTLKAKTHAG